MSQVNGEIPQYPNSSLFFDHLLTYPVVKDGVATFQSNELGRKSMKLSDTAYRRLAEPVIPYLSKPYQYVFPYLERVDQLGDQTLTKVDERFPIVKKPTDEIYADAKGFVLLPYNTGMQGKEHVLGVYSAECKKLGGESLLVYSKALVGTFFTIGGETLDWVGAYLNARKADAKDMANEKTNNN